VEKLLNINDLSEILGVTKATIYSWTSQNKIPHIKIGKRLLKFRESEILKWIEKISANNNAETDNHSKKNQKLSLKSSMPDDDIDRIIKRAKIDVSQQ
jgi:excisionase family DNA binding protein